MNRPSVGLLPLYLQFYDAVLPDLAKQLSPFVETVRTHLDHSGLDVSVAPIGRARPDFAAALKQFEADDVDAILTLHLAYSPSLESAEVLSHSKLPVILLDTTPDRDFGGHVDPMRLLENHGIHGVQDLASMLRRLRKPYRVVAGHVDDPSMIERCIATVRAARAAKSLHSMRVLRIGGIFPGMGDFAVADDTLRRTLGIKVENIQPQDLTRDISQVRDEAVREEIASDRRLFRVECDEEVHQRSVRIGLGLRRFLETGNFGAFSLNFLAFQDSTGPVNSVPFLECCKAMARGTGYAGEGDTLTASLVGALASGFGQVTFTEMFCPDWTGQSIFLSHMGEINPALAANPPLLYEKDYPFSPALNPAALGCSPRPGPATLVNLAPGPDDRFRLITAPVELLADGTHPDLDRWVRAWIRPARSVERFLEEYSHLGGTHHCALMLGDHTAALRDFSTFLKIEHCDLS